MRYLAWLVLVVVGCGDSASKNPDLAQASDSDLASGNSCGLKLTTLVSGLDQPTFVTAEDAHRLFAIERVGRVVVAVDGSLKSPAFLDLSAQVASAGDDDGLLGLALHPDFATNGRFFVQYSDVGSNVVIAEYARSAGNPDAATPGAIQTLLTANAAAHIRYGGMLAFSGGYLYSGVGDGAADGDPNQNAQNLASPLGKILRFDVDQPGTPPPGNLMGAVWDYGLREPWRFSFDRMTGELYLADVGHPTYQEIDVEPAGQGGRNYGWPLAAANHCFKAGCDLTAFTAPVAEYAKAGGCAIIGGYVYRGQAASCLSGSYVYSDWCTPKLHAYKDGATTDLDVTGMPGAISSFGESADGELLVVDYGDGKISRLDLR